MKNVIRTVWFQLRARYFPWTPPYKVRRILGAVGMVWLLMDYFMAGIVVADLPEAVAALGSLERAILGLALHFSMASLLMFQMPKRRVAA